eukprot:TRINITY_DN4497_c0_g2_i1.p1 TRINITY_DN4497_c0_g2~~TRINITY_DN4497_c0_g2_i1.p1  ORF type:complete len:309 (-),score=74.87 TRINITY_DN4497_c0_g2_i1:97-1023(-)
MRNRTNSEARIQLKMPKSPSKKKMKITKMGKNKIPKYQLVSPKLAQFPWEISIGDLFLEECLGTGGFGYVHKGYWKEQVVAVKKLKNLVEDDEDISEFLQEINILSNVIHQNIVEFIGANLGMTIYIVTEYCINGDLAAFLKKNVISHDEMCRYSTEIARGMEYLHGLTPPIVHRDLKCSNILLDVHLNAKICDFGLSMHMKNGSAIDEKLGTINWTAPNILFDAEPYTKKADIYSYAMTLYEISHNGTVPYNGLNELQVVRMVQQRKRPIIGDNVLLVLANLIRACWEDPENSRPDFQEIIEVLENI